MPPPLLGVAPPLAPPVLALLPLEPLLPPEFELLDPELPLLVLELLGLLVPPELGEDAPELEGVEGGVGIEGVVGVLAEGHPASIKSTDAMPVAPSNRHRVWGFPKALVIRFVMVAMPSPDHGWG